MSRLFGATDSKKSGGSVGGGQVLNRLSNGFTVQVETPSLAVEANNVAPFSLPAECLTFEPLPDSVITPFKNGDKERKIHCCIKLDDEEQASLKALQEEARVQNASFIPSVSLMATRYISRARGDAKKALLLMQKTQEWRQSYFEKGAIADKSVMEDLQHGIVYWAGRDFQLRPFIVIRANRVPKKWYKENSVDKMIRILVFCMEYYQRYMCVPGKIENNCVIVDLKGLGVTQVPISLLGEVYKVLNNYSGRVYRFYICNLSWSLKQLSSAATAILTDRQKQKMCFVDDKSELLKDIARHHLEEDLGGTRPVISTGNGGFFPFPLLPGPFDPSSSSGPDGNAVPNVHRAFTEAGALGFLWDPTRTPEQNTRLEQSPEAPEILERCGLPGPGQDVEGGAAPSVAASPGAMPENFTLGLPENPILPVPNSDPVAAASGGDSPEVKQPTASQDDAYSPQGFSVPAPGEEGPTVVESSSSRRPIEAKIDEGGVKPKSFWSCGVCWSGSPSQ